MTQASIERVEINDERVDLEYANGDRFRSGIPGEIDFYEFLSRENVDFASDGFPDVEVSSGGGFGSILGILINFLPLIIFGRDS